MNYMMNWKYCENQISMLALEPGTVLLRIFIAWRSCNHYVILLLYNNVQDDQDDKSIEMLMKSSLNDFCIVYTKKYILV